MLRAANRRMCTIKGADCSKRMERLNLVSKAGDTGAHSPKVIVVIPFPLILGRPPNRDLRTFEGPFKLPHKSACAATFAALIYCSCLWQPTPDRFLPVMVCWMRR